MNITASPRNSTATPTQTRRPHSQKQDQLEQFVRAGGTFYEDRLRSLSGGIPRFPFGGRDQPVSVGEAETLLEDGVDGNLEATVQGEGVRFEIDAFTDGLAAANTIYSQSMPEDTADPKAAKAIANLHSKGYTFANIDGRLAAKEAYDAVAHNSQGSRYVALFEPGTRTDSRLDTRPRMTFHTSRELGIFDYFSVSHDRQTLEQPAVAQMAEKWDKEGTGMYLWAAQSTPAQRYDAFMRTGSNQFGVHSVLLAKTEEGSLSLKSLEAAHQQALEKRPLVDRTIGKEYQAGRLYRSLNQQIYDKVMVEDVDGTTPEQRFEAFAEFNTSLINAQGMPVRFTFLEEANKVSLSLYETLASLSAPSELVANLGRSAEAVRTMPDLNPATVMEALLRGAGDKLKQLPVGQQVEVFAKLTKAVDTLRHWRERLSPEAGSANPG